MTNYLLRYGNCTHLIRLCFAALALAMARDGSSGGVIRMAVITEKGVERLFVPGDQLPGKSL